MTPGVPYDAEIEYLESDGTQYINTGIVPTIDTSCVLDYMDVTFVGWGVILGSATSDNNADSWYLRGNGVRPGFSFRIDGKYADQQIFVSLGTRVLCIASKDSFSVDDVTKTIGATAYSSAPTLPMYLFTCNLNGSIWRPCKGRVYSCKIFQGSVLVRHFIPVRVGTEGCLYDRVSRKLFCNQGTGSFATGPDVAVPVMGLHFMKRPGYTAKSYVRDGLVAMWDGIENAGWGVHNPNATVWKDLVGNGDMSLTYGSMTFSESACVVTNGLLRTTLGQIATALNGKEITVEAVYVATGRGYPIIAPNSSPALNIWNNGGNSMLFNIFGSNIGDLGWGVTVRDSSTPPLSHLVYAVSESDGNCRGYLDGALKKTTTLPATLTTGYSTTQDFGLGNSSGSGMSFNGQMSAMRIHSRALTASEIAHNYAVDKERFNLP